MAALETGHLTTGQLRTGSLSGGLSTAGFNERVRLAARNTPLRGCVFGSDGRFGHRWRVAAVRDRADVAGRSWLLSVGDGCVNGKPAQIGGSPLWRDPRPALTALAPDAALKNPGSFQRVSDVQRPDFFCTRAMWQYDLFRSSVVVSGTRPFMADTLLEGLVALPQPTTLVGLLADLGFRQVLASIGIQERIGFLRLVPPYVCQVGRFPLLLDGEPSQRLAWLYLLRQPGAAPALDQLMIKQECFWDLSAYSVLEDQGLSQIIPLLQATGEIAGNLSAFSIFETLLGTAKVRWWN